MGIPPAIIHFSRVFHYKPSILGYPHDYGTLQIQLVSSRFLPQHRTAAMFRCVSSMFQDPLPDVQCATSKRNDVSMKKSGESMGHGPLEHPGSWLMHFSCLTTLGRNPWKEVGTCSSAPRGSYLSRLQLLSLKAMDIHSGEFLVQLHGLSFWTI